MKSAALIALVAALVVPAPALAAWTVPVTIAQTDDANPLAQGAFGGSVMTGWLRATASVAKRSGDGFGAPAPITVADPFEKVWHAQLAQDGSAVVLTLRRHKPVQRVRATFVSPSGARSGPMTISDHSHSATQPVLSVAADGTAVAAWDWHDPAGWRVQAAIRKPGDAHFGAPQTVSPPAVVGKQHPRPFVSVAAGDDGRAVLAWQVGGDYSLPENDLHVLSASPDGVFGPDQSLPGGGGYADTALAVGATGEVQVAWLDEHFSGHETGASLHVTQGAAGAPLPAPTILSRGGKGTSSGQQVGAAFSADGSAAVAWAKPGNTYEAGGTLEVFARAPGAAFGPAQTIAGAAEGVALAGGPGASAALAWMTVGTSNQHSVHAATRPAAGGAFAPDTTISTPDRQALWPSLAYTADGDAIAAWVTNTSGGGSGAPTAAIHAAD